MATTLDYGLKKALKHLKSEARLHVLMALILHTNTRNRCWPGMDLIAEMTGYELATVTKAKHWLLEHSAIRLIAYDKRMDEELSLPKRQHIYELTGYLWVEEKGAKLYIPYLYGNVSQNETSNVSKSESSNSWNQSISNSSKVIPEELFSAPVGPDGDPQTEPANPLSSEEDLDAPKPTHSAAPRTPSDHQRRTEIIARELALDGNLDWELLDQSTRQGFFTRAAALWKRELKPIHEIKAITPEELARFAAGRVDKKKRLNFPTRDGVLAGAFSHWRGLDTLQREKPVKKRMQTVFDENGNPIGGQEVDG